MAQQRLIAPPALSIPRPPSFQPHPSLTKPARFYPTFTTPTSSKSSYLLSPTSTPTPSKRPRAPQGPLWLFTLLHLLSFYLLGRWLSTTSSTPPLAIFTFVSFVIAALCLNIIYRPWKGRQILFHQWCLIFISGTLLTLSYYLCFQGLRLAGPLETIFAEFAGFLATKVLLDSSYRNVGAIRKARGLAALLLGLFFLSYGWARVPCSPIAIDISHRTRIKLLDQPADCLRISPMLAPFLGGFFSACQQMMGAKTALKNIGKKRIQVLSYAMGSFALFPAAILQLAIRFDQNLLHFGSSFWFAGGIVAFGMIISFFNESYAEEKLFLSVYSLEIFQIVACSVCGLELLFGLDVSLVGFAFCCVVLALGVQELCLVQGQLPWDELMVTSGGSLMFSSWIRRPLQHIFSDTKSRKIAIFLLINTAFMFVEFFYGFLRNSLGLISDACHMLFDCAALAIGLYASYISRLPQNTKYNYGYGRFEVVSGYANAVLLVLVASLIVLESIERILEPPEISTESLLVVSIGGLLVNIVGLIFFHEEHHHAHAHSGHSCSHSHGSHPHVSESTHEDSKVVLSSITSDRNNLLPFHNQDQSVTSADNDMYSSMSNLQGMNSFHSMPHNDQNKVPHAYHQDHDHHVCRGHDVHVSLQLSNHPIETPKDTIQHKHTHSPSRDHHQYEEDGAHASVHSHACSSGHACHDSKEHHFEDNAHQHNHGKSGFLREHSHAYNGVHQRDGHYAHSHDHQYSDKSNSHHHHHHHHGTESQSHGDCQKHKHLDHNLAHNDDGHYHNHGHDHNLALNDDDHYHNHGHDHQHHMDHNMYGIFLHVLADTLGSVGVVISTLLIKYKGWLITDPACSIFLSVLIISSVVPLLKNSAEILLQRAPRHNERSFSEAIKRIRGLNGVQSVECVHIWSFTNTEVVGSLHLQLVVGSDRKMVQEKSLKLLREVGVKDLTIQIEEGS